MRYVFISALFAVISVSAFAADIIVPDDQSTIQDAIQSASSGDIILVRPGTYTENINFLGKAIALRSMEGPSQTVIDGSQSGSTVLFNSAEDQLSILEGFTITNGSGTPWWSGVDLIGGGICCWDNTEPVIRNNWITGNTIFAPYVADGGGVAMGWYAAPTIKDNLIFDNWAVGANGALGGGIAFGAFSSGQAINNFIFKNTAGSPDPKKSGSHSCLRALNGAGGAIALGEDSDPVITNNTLVANDAFAGGGIYAYLSQGRVYNTISWDNFAHAGSEISVAAGTLSVTYSDVKGGWPGTGNMDKAPHFRNSVGNDYHLSGFSPCLERGTNGAEALPSFDIDGEARVLPGLGSHPMDQPPARPKVDVGADEFDSRAEDPIEFPIKKG